MGSVTKRTGARLNSAFEIISEWLSNILSRNCFSVCSRYITRKREKQKQNPTRSQQSIVSCFSSGYRRKKRGHDFIFISVFIHSAYMCLTFLRKKQLAFTDVFPLIIDGARPFLFPYCALHFDPVIPLEVAFLNTPGSWLSPASSWGLASLAPWSLEPIVISRWTWDPCCHLKGPHTVRTPGSLHTYCLCFSSWTLHFIPITPELDESWEAGGFWGISWFSWPAQCPLLPPTYPIIYCQKWQFDLNPTVVVPCYGDPFTLTAE